jgi:hypothetical protein
MDLGAPFAKTRFFMKKTKTAERFLVEPANGNLPVLVPPPDG